MNRNLLYIAMGSILAGIIIYYWPVPCESGLIFSLCFNRSLQLIKGLFIGIAGIALLFLPLVANARYRVVAIMGIVLNFLLAVITLLGSILVISTDLIVFMLTAIQAMSFIYASMSARWMNFGWNPFYEKAHPDIY